MTQWFVRYIKFDGEECMVVLPSFWKLFLWFLCTARQCDDIINRNQYQLISVTQDSFDVYRVFFRRCVIE